MPFKPKRILLNAKAETSEMARHVRAAHPEATVQFLRFNTESWNGNATDVRPSAFYAEKTASVAVLHRTATWTPDPNGRSTDFLPNIKLGTGCAFFCQYCYVERGKPNSYPKVFDDAYNMVKMVQQTLDNLEIYREKFKKICKKDLEMFRDPNHPPFVSFDLGCDTDCTIDNQITRHALYSGHVIDIMNQIAEIPGAMTSFATKGVELDPFIQDCKHPERNRIRLSLMPEHQRRVLELNTATIQDRLQAVNKLVKAGFEVHINLSPIVVTDTFAKDYKELLKLIDDVLTQEAKQQLAYEIIFLTHAKEMFEPVAERRPEAHQMMVNGPLTLEAKWNKPKVLSYGRADKNVLKKWLTKTINKITPYARVRYMF